MFDVLFSTMWGETFQNTVATTNVCVCTFILRFHFIFIYNLSTLVLTTSAQQIHRGRNRVRERESAKDKDSGGEIERESFGYTHTRTHTHQHTCAHACDRAKTLKTQLSTDDAQTEKSQILRERKRVSDKPNRSTDQTNEPNSTPANWRLNRKPEETRNQAKFIELFAPKPLTEGKQKQRSKLSSKKTWQVQAQLKRAKWVWIREWEWERVQATYLSQLKL